MSHGFQIITIPETISTNLLMQEWKKADRLKKGDLIRAINQSAGLGQKGNYWESEADKNLTFSLFLETDFIEAADVFQLNKIISLSLLDYLTAKGISQVKIKWPNDMYVGTNKIAGMLTHNSFLGDKLENSIVGIGLNINQTAFVSEAPNPVSLQQITGIVYDLEEELELLLQCIEQQFNDFKNNEPIQLNINYLNNLYGYDQNRPFKDSEGTFFGKIKGVDSFGRLLVKKNKGKLYTYDMKEIEFL